MKKLTITLLLYVLMLSPSYAVEPEFKTPYNLLNPPAKMEFNRDQSIFYFTVTSGCSYLYALQSRHATMSHLIDGGQSSKDWSQTSYEQYQSWTKLAIIFQAHLVRDHAHSVKKMNEYKVRQVADLNQFFSLTFYTIPVQEYFNRLINSTSYCVQYQESVVNYLKMIEPFESKPAPGPDKPKRKM